MIINLTFGGINLKKKVNKTEKQDHRKSSDIEIAKDESNQNGIKDEDGEDGEGKDNTTEDSNILSMKQQRKLELRQRKLVLTS